VIVTERPQPVPADVAAALLKPLETGKTELETARTYYQQNPDKAYPFARYKEFEVCRELDKLFKRKCAYCETKYEATAARDVEHFRPKGAVAKAPQHPGYWWLAAEWTNLLPSCPACNQRRRHVEYQQGMTLEEIELAEQTRSKRTFGKGNTFPVRGDNWVTSEAGNLAAEDPLSSIPACAIRKATLNGRSATTASSNPGMHHPCCRSFVLARSRPVAKILMAQLPSRYMD
jgi:hypothetical protein